MTETELDLVNYPYSKAEKMRLQSDSGFVPELVLNLESAIRSDTRNLLCALADEVNDQAEICWIKPTFDRRESTLERALEMAQADEKFRNGDEYPPTYGCAAELIFEIARASLDLSIGTISVDDYEIDKNEIYTCFLALTLGGSIEAACSLGRLARGLRGFVESPLGGSILPGRAKRNSLSLKRLEVIRTLRRFLREHKVPSIMALRHAAFSEFFTTPTGNILQRGNEKDPADFSRLISVMAIRSYLVADRSNLKIPGGKVYSFHPLSFH